MAKDFALTILKLVHSDSKGIKNILDVCFISEKVVFLQIIRNNGLVIESYMTRLECSALRCIAIVSIMLHNFAHWLPDAAPENEFSFSLEHYNYFWEQVIGRDFLIQVFSFFGHLGVPIFVFLTGYGLAQKYDRKEHLEWKSFLYNHWKKLFIPLVVGTFAYLLVMFVMEGHLVCSVSRIIAQCTMLLNFISPMHLLPMPYWYLGMTMQLYIIYVLLVHKRTI